jgi:hypothetical protein
MPATWPRERDAPLAAQDQFLEVLCADEDLVRAEFDAIIAAEWPSPPPAKTDHGPDAERAPRRGRWPDETHVPDLSDRPRDPGAGGWTRQRSPPARGTDNRKMRKAGDVPTWITVARADGLLARTFHPLRV